MNTVQEVINDILQKEGGFVNHPDDRGGPTNFGITLKTYQKYKKNATIEDLKRMLKVEAFTIYEIEYYRNTKIDKLTPISSLIAAEVLDTAVHMGPVVAISFLQQCLNAFNNKQEFYRDLVVDGIIGNATIQALTAYKQRRGTLGEVVLLKALNCLQGARYIELSQKREANESFVFGWINNRVHL